ncbi:hypothetical protein BCR44DRAFT_48045, partial [Catenaria anguillulae PL171]
MTASASAPPLHHTISGPPSWLSHLNLTIASASLLLTFLLTLHSLALIVPRVRSTRHPRLLLLFTSTLFNLGSLISNTSALILIHLGLPTNLLHYYLARTVFFVGFAPLHTIAVLRRILILVASPATHARALWVAYLTCALGYGLATAGLWVATLESMHLGTLDAWMYLWTLPWYGTVAGAVFPLINVGFCAWSLRFAWVHKTVGRGTYTATGAGGGSAGTLGSGSSMAVGGVSGAVSTRTGGTGVGNDLSSVAGNKGSVRVPMSKAPSIAARSIASFVLSSTSAQPTEKSAPTRDVGEKSVASAFWYLTIGEIAAGWFTLGSALHRRACTCRLSRKNCVYDVLRVAIVVLEASFEQIYRRRYNRAKEKTEAAKQINSSMMLSTIGAYGGAGGGAVTHVVFPSSGNAVAKEKLVEATTKPAPPIAL